MTILSRTFLPALLWLVMAVPAFAAGVAPKVLQLPMRTDGPKSLDPAVGSTQYDNIAVSQIFETLLTFKYNSPNELEPLLLAEMPASPDNGLTWNFTLKPGVRFHDSPHFAGGKGRPVTADDVFFSLKRLADPAYAYKNYWLLEGSIKGLDEYKAAQKARVDAGQPFDYNAPVAGFVKLSDDRFSITLTKPVFRFLYILAQFQTSIVPRECVEKSGSNFAFEPVGTGPFLLDQWTPKQRLTLNRNPAYHRVLYPARDAWSRDDRRRRLDRAAGQPVPFVDRLEFTMYVEDQPMWLQFNAGNLGYTEVPTEYFDEAFDRRTRELKPDLSRAGVSSHQDLLLDFVFMGFNMEDPLLGGYTPEKRALRQAICLAIDNNEVNEVIYNGTAIVYDGMIPASLDGHPENHRVAKDRSWQGPDLARSRAKLGEAGYPDGKGLPPIRYYTSISSVNQQHAELIKRQLEKVNIRFEPVFVDFSTLIENINNKKAPFFGFAWGSDYPDAENNLALFYGPNESPGSNHYNYKNAEFDRMYEQILSMSPGPDRTAKYATMRDIVLADTVFSGSFNRTRFYLMAPWILNCRPTERTWSWLKYLDVDDAKRAG